MACRRLIQSINQSNQIANAFSPLFNEYTSNIFLRMYPVRQWTASGVNIILGNAEKIANSNFNPCPPAKSIKSNSVLTDYLIIIKAIFSVGKKKHTNLKKLFYNRQNKKKCGKEYE